MTEETRPPGAVSHPDVSSHDALGLATQAELDSHAAGPHGGNDFGEVGDISASAFGDTAAAGVTAEIADAGHRHAREANPVTAHEAAGNPHPSYATDADLTAHEAAANPHTGYATDGDLSGHAATAHGLSSHAIDGAFHSGADVLPTTGQKNALAGTSGVPGDLNRYVTDADARLSDDRDPTAHAHLDADIPPGIARDSEVATAVSDHAATPHGAPLDFGEVGDISAEAFGDTAAAGATAEVADAGHRHAMPANPVTAHEAAGDPHPAYETSAEVDAKVTAHEGLANPHPTYATDADLTSHAGTPHGTDFGEVGDIAASAFGDTAAAGATGEIADAAHRHAREADPVTAHEAAANPHPTYETSAEAAQKVTDHEAAADPHTGYRKESDDHSHATAGAQGGTVAHSALTGLTAGDPHTQYQQESEKAAASGYASLDASTKVPIAEIPTGQTGTTVPLGNDARFTDARTPTAHATSHQPGGGDAMAVDAAAATGSLRTLGTGAAQAAVGSHGHTLDFGEVGDIVAEAFGDTAAAGATGEIADAGHRHAMPADPVTAHEAAGDPHTGYVREADANWTDLTDNGPTTLHSHAGGAASDPNMGSYAPGSFTVPTGDYAIMVMRLQLTTTQRATLAGTARLRIT